MKKKFFLDTIKYYLFVDCILTLLILFVPFYHDVPQPLIIHNIHLEMFLWFSEMSNKKKILNFKFKNTKYYN